VATLTVDINMVATSHHPKYDGDSSGLPPQQTKPERLLLEEYYSMEFIDTLAGSVCIIRTPGPVDSKVSRIPLPEASVLRDYLPPRSRNHSYTGSDPRVV